RDRRRRSGGELGGLVPAAAERAVERDLVLQLQRLRLHEQDLRREERARRVERVEEARRPRAIAQVGEAVGDLQRVGLRRLRAQLLAERRATGETVGDLAERVLDRMLVLGDGDVEAGARE